MKKIALLLSLIAIFAVSCEKVIQENLVSNLSFTPCQQNKLKGSTTSDNVNVEFTNNGVKITYNNFAVTCDFSTVDVTFTFVNGFLNITQQGSPNLANCVCYTDVSYTINGFSQNDVNVIFINGKQVYCHNGTIPNDSIHYAIGKVIAMLDPCSGGGFIIDVETPNNIGVSGNYSFNDSILTYNNAIRVPYFNIPENLPFFNGYKIEVPASFVLFSQIGKTWNFEYRNRTSADDSLFMYPVLCTWNNAPPSVPVYIITKINNIKNYPIEIPFNIIGQRDLYGNGREGFTKQFSVIKTQTDWENLKMQLNSVNNVTDNFMETDIDFSKYQSIFVIDEVKGNGGWSIDVTNITENSNNIVVTVSNINTGNATSVMTQPFEIIKIPATNKPIIFNDLTYHNQNYPIDIPFTDYSLVGTSCQWQWANLAINKVAVIKSNDELTNYIVCTDSTQQIDFSKYTLLVARGGASSNIVSIKKQFQQTSVNEYSLNVDITLGMAAVAQGWYISIRTPKLSQNSVVTLNVNNHY